MSTITHGMDVGEVRRLSSNLQRHARVFDSAERSITSALSRAPWQGGDARTFATQWRSTGAPTLTRCADWLEASARFLNEQAEQQERASSVASGGFFGDIIGGIGDGLSWVGEQVGDGIAWIGEQVGDGIAWVGDQVGAAWDAVADRASAGWAGAVRTWDAAQQVVGALAGELRDGKIPEPAQVLAGLSVIGGSAIGTLGNIVTGKDLHFFDDGEPRVGTPELAGHGGGPQSMNDVLATSQASYDTEGLVVTATVGPDGVTRFIVTVPGTQADIGSMDGWAGKANGRDWAANLWGIGTGTTSATQAAQQATLDAIEAYRADHPDAVVGDTPEILLVGHSQGGIIAANMASDSSFTSQVNVVGMANMAGPIDTAEIPGDIPTLSLTNGQGRADGDLVPRLDLGGWAGTPDNITEVRFPALGPAWDLRSNHEVDGYLNGAASPEGQAAIDAWVAENPAVENFYTGNPDQAETYNVDFGRAVD